jgi:hypothetical protein
MTKEHSNVLEAKRSLKDHIKFMEILIKHLNGPDKLLRGRATWAAWCIHRYLNDKLIGDIQDAIKKNTPSDSNLPG